MLASFFREPMFCRRRRRQHQLFQDPFHSLSSSSWLLPSNSYHDEEEDSHDRWLVNPFSTQQRHAKDRSLEIIYDPKETGLHVMVTSPLRDLKIFVSRDQKTLVVQGKQVTKWNHGGYTGTKSTSFVRHIPLPENVDPAQVETSLDENTKKLSIVVPLRTSDQQLLLNEKEKKEEEEEEKFEDDEDDCSVSVEDVTDEDREEEEQNRRVSEDADTLLTVPPAPEAVTKTKTDIVEQDKKQQQQQEDDEEEEYVLIHSQQHHDVEVQDKTETSSEAYTVSLSLPQPFTQKDVSLKFDESRVLRIVGRHTQQNKQGHKHHLSFSRQYQVPEDVVLNGIKARFDEEKHLLVVQLPRQQVQSMDIEIK